MLSARLPAHADVHTRDWLLSIQLLLLRTAMPPRPTSPVAGSANAMAAAAGAAAGEAAAAGALQTDAHPQQPLLVAQSIVRAAALLDGSTTAWQETVSLTACRYGLNCQFCAPLTLAAACRPVFEPTTGIRISWAEGIASGHQVSYQ